MDEEDEPLRQARADVAVIDSRKLGIPPSWKPEDDNAAAVTLAEPRLVRREPETERWVEITTVHGRLVTVIEVLSPANKSGAGREKYLRKRASYEQARVNIVEIDLLRKGTPTVAAQAEECDPAAATLYTICVFRAARPACHEVYHWSLIEAIPAFAVPLRETDPDAPLNLQPLLNRCYEMGYYWQEPYATRRIEPPLPEVEQSFVTERLRQAGLIE